MVKPISALFVVNLLPIFTHFLAKFLDFLLLGDILCIIYTKILSIILIYWTKVLPLLYSMN